MARFREVSFFPRRIIAHKLGVEFDPDTLEISFQGNKVGRFLRNNNGLVIEEDSPFGGEIINKAKQLDFLQPDN